jgi:hypothetical protein
VVANNECVKDIIGSSIGQSKKAEAPEEANGLPHERYREEIVSLEKFFFHH